VFRWLSRNVVEVDVMPDAPLTAEEERGEGDDLVELDVRVERDVLLERELSDLGDQVAAHGEQQQGVAERQRGGRAPRDGDADAHHVPQVHVLRHVRV
ncbi:unnamed protein product, partial [Ixodes pacificus]